MTQDQRLIEDYLPIEAISAEAKREKSIRKGHISTLHLWWARRPLVACRAAVYGALVPAPATPRARHKRAEFVAELCTYPGPADKIADAQRHILEAHAARLSQETGETVTVADIEAGRAPRPRVLDMFAGGGAIPLEALRLGCEAHALELNPVAHLIELCTLVYPQQYGQPDPAVRGSAKDGIWAGLAKEVEHWGKWVLEQVKVEIGDVYAPIPMISSDEQNNQAILIPAAYLWTRTVRCKNPSCGGTVPLARQTWLARRKGRYIALRPNPEARRHRTPEEKQIEYQMAEAITQTGLGFNPSHGSRAGSATCPFCGTAFDNRYVKEEGQEGRIGIQPMAVAYTHSDRRGKVYLSPDQVPPSTWPDDASIQERILALEAETASSFSGPLTVPKEEIVTDAKSSAWVIQYGLERFGDLFTPRQLLALLTFAKHIRNAYVEMSRHHYSAEAAKAIATYLGLWCDRIAGYCSSLCVWKPSGENVSGIFARQALPMIWDFAEVNPLGDASGNASLALKWITDVIQNNMVGTIGRVTREDARNMPFEPAFFDAVVTDPPYYDNVAYADLSDFFYVWLKRSIGYLHPEHFSSPLAPKDSETVADATRHRGDREQAAMVYEEMMAQALVDTARVLKPGAPLIMIYPTITATARWAALVDSLRLAGFAVTGTWPLDLVRSARTRIFGVTSSPSSILVVARREQNEQVGSYEQDVIPCLQEIVRKRMEELWPEGITGMALNLACLGAGLRAFTRFVHVKRVDGQAVTTEAFIEDVQKTISQALLEGVLNWSPLRAIQIDAPSLFYVTWRYTFLSDQVATEEAVMLANALGIKLDGPDSLSHGANPLIEIWGARCRLRDFLERGSHKELGTSGPEGYPPLIDILHRVLWLMEYRLTDLPSYLSEVQPDEKQLLFLAQALADLAGRETGRDARSEGEGTALVSLIANWQNLVVYSISRKR